MGTGNHTTGDTYSGIENLTGGTGTDKLTSDSNDNMLDGGTGTDTLAGGAGKDALTGEPMKILLSSPQEAAGITVFDYTAGTDSFDLSGVFGINDFSELTLVQNAADVTISWDVTGESILIKNITVATLTSNQSDFLFG